MDSPPNESGSSQPPVDQQAKSEPKPSPIDKLMSIAPDQEFTGAEISEIIADLINVVRKQQPELWIRITQDAQREFAKFEAMPTNQVASIDPHMILEQTYQDLQSNLIQLRQSVAQAIATEKVLEQQLQKNEDQSKTWAERANMALQQKHADLQEQALSRQKQYVLAAEELSKQLEIQRLSTRSLREQLTEMEGGVQKAYTKKQVFIARQAAAQATIKAKASISAMDFQPAIEQLAKTEKAVEELEWQAASASFNDSQGIEIDSNTLLVQMALALDNAVKVINALQAKLPKTGNDSPQSTETVN